MQGIVRLPIDFNSKDTFRYTKAIRIWAGADWDEAIKLCCQEKDMESLCQFPYLQSIADIFFRPDIPKIKIIEGKE